MKRWGFFPTISSMKGMNEMSCKSICSVCPNLVVSTAVTFADDTLTINIPEGSYANGQKVCLVIAQNIPAATTIDAPVVVTIGTGTAEYPFLRFNGTQATARELRTRTRYTTCVQTTATSGAFRLVGKICNNIVGSTLPAIDGTELTPAPGG